MKDLGILNELSEVHLADVKFAVERWVNGEKPGVFGFIDMDQLNEIGTKAVNEYRLKQLNGATYGVAVMMAVGWTGYGIYKLKKRFKKDKTIIL